MAVVTDQKVAISTDGNTVAYFVADVISATDYYAFGSPVPGRSFSLSAYRYGFNGMEKDNEISGAGSSYYTEFRQYDPRIGRWGSVDPIMQPWMSPYCAMDNNPISFVDPFGLKAGDGDKGKKKDKTPDMGEQETVKVEGEPVRVKYKKWKEGQWLAYGRDVKKKDYKQWKRGDSGGGSSENNNTQVERASWWQFSEGFMDNTSRAMRWSPIQTGREFILSSATGANDSWMGTLKGMEQVHHGVQQGDVRQAAGGIRDIADNLSSLNPKSRILRTLLGMVNAADMMDLLMGDSPILQSSDANEIDWENPPSSPNDLSDEWEDVTHPDQKGNTNDRRYRNKESGEEIEFHPNDKNGPNPHWHRHNPNRSGKDDYYLDKHGAPVRKGSKPSHIYTK